MTVLLIEIWHMDQKPVNNPTQVIYFSVQIIATRLKKEDSCLTRMTSETGRCRAVMSKWRVRSGQISLFFFRARTMKTHTLKQNTAN